MWSALGPRRPRLRIGTLQWTIGIFCAVLGALMLVIPHQFGSPYGVLQYYLPWLGASYVVAGTALLGTAVLKPGWPVVAGVHTLAGLVISLMAVGFSQGSAWTGVVVYLVLGMGTILAPSIGHVGDAGGDGDCFSWLMGAVAMAAGISMLAFPTPFGAPAQDASQPLLGPVAIALFTVGFVLSLAQLRPLERHWTLAGHLGVAAIFGLWLFTVALPNRIWSGIVLFGGLGFVLAILPWVGPRLRRLDPTSLRTRLSLALALATALPLIGTVAIAAGHNERFARTQALQVQQILAAALAQDVSDYVSLHRAAVEALAGYPSLSAQPPELHQELVNEFARAYPDIIAFGTFDQQGLPIRMSGEEQLFSLATTPTFLEVQLTNVRAMGLSISPTFQRPVFIIASPMRDEVGRFNGAVIGVLESARLVELLDRTLREPSSQAYLVDAQGRVLAHPQVSLGAWSADLSTHPPVAALLRGSGLPDTLSYTSSAGEQLTGFARIQGLRWGIVVEQPLSTALAGPLASRETALIALLVAITIAALLGLLAAERLVQPLRALSLALDQLAAGNARAPLPSTTTREVSHLAQVFDEMRERLASRTAEREQAERALAEELARRAGLAIDNARLYRQARTAQEELRRQLDFSSAINASLAEGVCAVDTEGRITFANHAAELLLGWNEADLLGRELRSVLGIDADTAESDSQEFAIPRVLQSGATAHVREVTFFRRDGTTVPVDYSSSPITQDGRIVGAVITFRDIGDRQRMEEQLRRAQRLETAGRIAGEVAHDFNNLLAPLVGFPELIKMRLPDDHPAREYCDTMLASAQQMAAINENLLALGRRGHFEYGPLDLNRLVQEAIEPLFPSGSQPASLELQLELAPDLLPVNGAAPQLIRVVTNLVMNAREAMEDQGQVIISTSNVYLDASVGHLTPVEIGEYVRLDVADTGPGIPEEIQAQVFDAFFTTRTTSRRRGSGLGLSVVQSIVTDHGGVVDLQSTPGLGTRFSVYLPVSREAVEELEAATVPGGDESILIVDDDPVQREVAQRLLESLGYRADVVGSGEGAVEYLAEQAVDLLVLDMIMESGIDGAETLRRIRETNPQQRAIIVSGFAESERVAEALALGAGGFLRKPVTRTALARAVREELDRPPGASTEELSARPVSRSPSGRG